MSTFRESFEDCCMDNVSLFSVRHSIKENLLTLFIRFVIRSLLVFQIASRMLIINVMHNMVK